MFTNMANGYTAILAELIRLNGGGAVPVFTTKGQALTDIKYQADILKNGSASYPAYTSEGQLLDDIATLLTGVSLGGGGLTPGTPVVVDLSTSDPEVPGVTGTATFTPIGTDVDGHDIIQLDLNAVYPVQESQSLNFTTPPFIPLTAQIMWEEPESKTMYIYSDGWEFQPGNIGGGWVGSYVYVAV